MQQASSSGYIHVIFSIANIIIILILMNECDDLHIKEHEQLILPKGNT